ncbi:sensor domain-containing diguanylate cyclase [Lysinibacillus sp. SGAir0095]|uniref:sensor domain-containing diguanylate cyclase n=1 Tax=Lysinibacillus sp. SGAir0095 TaxID=2070463 RepID=UPI0010CCFFDC|nr:sensor domain-containing diguanylate cyclase [Lysinibacillus sp. SGAir0095]QCR33073.1 GGDEF domain-containing protein [Lysinibacillus sp. SGAir0095]
MHNLSGKLKLKYLMIGLIILAFLLSLASSLYSSYQRSINVLENQTLEKNRVYALKLSQIVNLYLDQSLQVLEYSAAKIADQMDNEELLNYEASRLLYQQNAFNSVVIANKNGLMLAGAPEKNGLKGTVITSEVGTQQIKNQVPSISDPFRATTGKLLVTVSYPIFTSNGNYQGVVNGSIYIHESNFFESILGEHQYQDGSNVYVVDSNGKIIYHLVKSRLGVDVSNNKVVQRIEEGDSGAQLVTNQWDEEMLAGFSPLEKANWGVVVQTPHEVAINSVGNQVLTTFYFELPLLIISIIIVLLLAAKITKPLQQIATLTENSINESEMGNINRLNAWYYEASQIKKALIQSFSFLHGQVSILKDENTIDPLTSLTNRRALDTVLHSWTVQGKMYSVIMLDIDHFKSINDTYGHAVGDDVLKFLSIQMRTTVREQDLCCRYGGEEFIILLPETGVEEAYDIAEHLRKNVEGTTSPIGKTVTFSAGIAGFPKQAGNSKKLIEVADNALYEAKKLGRNRVVIAKEELF